jgi:Circadian oscillating protein COP23
MKYLRIFLVIFATSSFLNTLSSAKSSHAQEKKPLYSCENNRTVVYTPRRGKIELIVWKSDFFAQSGFTAESRCQVVSARFQKFADAQKLKFVSTGTINNQAVICVSNRSGECLSNGVLLTLEPTDNPKQVLNDLFNLSARSSGGGITRGDGDKTVIDVTRLLYTSDAT